MPLLTVAIPTYKRASHLEKIIKAFKAEKNQDFTLLICDDHSLDDTAQMVKQYAKEMPNLVFYENTENLGYSGNVCKIYELAQTRYVWFLCNDEEVLPGCIDITLNVINKYEPSVAVFNYYWTDPFGRTLMGGPKEDTLHSSFATKLDYAAFMRITFVSIVLVEKIIAVDAIKKTNYKDNVYFQLSLCLEILKKRFCFYEIARPILHRYVGFKYGDFIKFILVDHLKAIFSVPTPFNTQNFINWSQSELLTDLQLYLSQKLGLFKYNAKPTKETINYLWKFYKFYTPFILLFSFIKFVVPSFVLKTAYFIRLVSLHGYSKAKQVYKSNINRAVEDKRETSFTSYR